MRRVLPILLAAVLAISGVPHALCACGCSWIGRSRSDTARGARPAGCPHCGGHQTQDDGEEVPPGGPQPCDCGSCDVRVAVVPRSAASSALAWSDTWQRVIDVPLSLPAVAVAPISPRARAPAFPPFALPVRALPILLGHLLL
jgi:hypothetical protein